MVFGRRLAVGASDCYNARVHQLEAPLGLLHEFLGLAILGWPQKPRDDVEHWWHRDDHDDGANEVLWRESTENRDDGGQKESNYCDGAQSTCPLERTSSSTYGKPPGAKKSVDPTRDAKQRVRPQKNHAHHHHHEHVAERKSCLLYTSPSPR